MRVTTVRRGPGTTVRTTSIVLAAALAWAVRPTAAQTLVPVNPHERSGFFIGFGVGYGALDLEGGDGTEGGVSGLLRIGGALSQRLLIGASLNGWTRSEGGATLSFGTLTGALHLYPSATQGYFVTAGAGLGAISLTGFDRQYGFGLLLGLGYDARVGRNVSVTPFLNGFGSSIEGATVTVAQLGVGVTFH